MTIAIKEDGTFDSGAIGVSSTAAYQEVARLTLGGRFRAGLFHLDVGSGGAINGLKFTRGLRNGPEMDWVVDGNFATATEEFIDVLPAGSVYQTAAGGSVQVKLKDLDGVPEIAVWMKAASAPTSGRVRGQVF